MSITAARRPRGVQAALAAAISFVMLVLAAQAAQASMIDACVKPKSGATRIVGAKARCHKGEQKLSWSTSGPAGAPGAKGAEGKPGANGANGAVAGFSAFSTGAETLNAKLVTIVHKVVPPGSYVVAGKTVILAESESAVGFAERRISRRRPARARRVLHQRRHDNLDGQLHGVPAPTGHGRVHPAPRPERHGDQVTGSRWDNPLT